MPSYSPPDPGIEKWIIGGGRRADIETGANNIAPDTPFSLLGRLTPLRATKFHWYFFLHDGIRPIGDVQVSMMKWAGKPLVASGSARALMYLFSSQFESPDVYDGHVEIDQAL